MSSTLIYGTLRCPPPDPFLCVAVLGTSAQLKNDVGNLILHDEQAFCADRNQLMQSRNQKFHVVNTADFFDKFCQHRDQQIIDFMAVSHPGPDLFILVVDPAEATEEKVVAQITKLGEIFGDSMLPYLVVLLQDAQGYRSLRHLMDQFKITVAVQKENLASDCQRWCCDRSTFCYEYSIYSEKVVTRRKKTLANKNYHTTLSRAGAPPQPQLSHNKDPPYNQASMLRPTDPPSRQASMLRPPDPPSRQASMLRPTDPPYRQASMLRPTDPPYRQASMLRPPDPPYSQVLLPRPADPIYESIKGAGISEYTLVLLGLSGRGKSASGNTILKAGGSKPSFRSELRCVPVTRLCEVKFSYFGIPVKVVDTPDFFSDQIPSAQQQLAQCREYCQSDHCTILLVFQLGRFSEAEVGLVTRFENALGIRIRRRTIILLTHAEDLEGKLGDYLITTPPLKNMIQECENNCQLFNNKSKDVKQVKQLLKKIPYTFSLGRKKNDCPLS